MTKFFPLRVAKINRETPKAVSIVFDVPQEYKEQFAFKAGQYITIDHTLNGQNLRRSYSICSSPTSGEHCVAVKEVDNGAFSKYANSDLREGDTLQVLPPEGRFVVEPDSQHQKNYVAFAAGSGITPIMSIVKTVLKQEPQSKFLLVYGNKSPEETIFLKQLMDLQTEHPERFFLELVFSQTQEDDAQFGRISTSIVNYFLKNKYKDISFDAHYLCGPEAMINEVKENLLNNGVKENAIFFELFTSSEPEKPIEVTEGATQLTIVLDDEETSFVMPQDKAVLDAALDEGLDPPYSCQGGICSTCIARIVEGKAEMRKNQILTDAEIEEGLVLTCQALPKSAVLKIDYDDV